MTPSVRWKAIKGLRANLVLLVAGCLLLALSGLWRLTIAPSIKIVAGDFDTLRSCEGRQTRAVAVQGEQPPAQETVQPVVIESRTASRKDLTTSTVSVVQVDTRVLDRGSMARLSTDSTVFAIDRKTGRLVSFEGLPRRRGYYIVFPFNSPKGEVPYWSELTGSTHPAKFHSEKKVKGTTFYVYRYSYGGASMAGPPPGYPARMTGAEMKEMLSEPGLPVSDATVLTPKYTASGKGELMVEPVMGTVASRTGLDESVSITVEDAASNLLLTRMLYKVTCDEVEASVAGGVGLASTELAKYRLQFLYIPLGLFVLAVACLAVALFAGTKRFAVQSGLTVSNGRGRGRAGCAEDERGAGGDGEEAVG